MILSEHTLKGNGVKLVKEFLSTLESATSWLDIRDSLSFIFSWKTRSIFAYFNAFHVKMKLEDNTLNNERLSIFHL